MHRITRVEALDSYRLALVFEDGTTGTADLSNLAGRGVFALWNDYETFREVRIGDAGELVWKDQIDLCPDALYIRVTGKAPEDVFPALRSEKVHA
jgi:hypothetical protein